jgi:UDP-glucose 4-epimerase
MNILVIGGAGFIGSHLVEQLITLGHTVAVLDNLSAGKREYVPHGVKFYQTDILSADLAQVFDEQKPTVVYHLAAQKNLRRSIDDPVFDAEINIMGSLKVLEQAARYSSRVIFSSSAAVYGNNNIASDEDGITKPMTPYGITKLAVEHYLQFYQQQHKLPVAIFRFANVYGPRQNPNSEAGVIALFCQWVLEHKPLKVNGDGLQTRDFVYVKDIVQALLYGLDHDGIYNVGTGVETSLQDIINGLTSLAQTKPTVEYQPAILGEVSRFTFKTDKIRALGWQPEISVEDGLRQTYAWLQSTQHRLQ